VIDAPNQAYSGTSSSDALRVSDAMGPVVAVAPDATLREIAQRMLQRQVQGVLVVDEQSRAIGIVTEPQLACDDRYLRLASLWLPDSNVREAARLDGVDAACAAATSLRARDVMDKRWLCVDSNERLGTVVERMNRRETDSVVVHKGGEVVGLLSRHDLLRRVAGEPIAARAPSPTPHVSLRHDRRSWFAWLTGAGPY